jgi:hypothetical protein
VHYELPVATKRITVVESTSNLTTDFIPSDFIGALEPYFDPLGDHLAYWYVRNIDLIFEFVQTTAGGVTADVFDFGRHLAKIRLTTKAIGDLYDIEGASLFHALTQRSGKWTGNLPEMAASESGTTQRWLVRLPIMHAVGDKWADTAILAAAFESLNIQTPSVSAMVVTGGSTSSLTQGVTIKIDLVAYPKLVVPQPFKYRDFDPGSTTVMKVPRADRIHLFGVVEDDDANVGTHRVTLENDGQTIYSNQRLREIQMDYNHTSLWGIDALDDAGTEVRLRLAEGNATWQPLLWEPLGERRLTKARRGTGTIATFDTAQASTARCITLTSESAKFENALGMKYVENLPESIKRGRWEAVAHANKDPRRRSNDVPDTLRKAG